jgi:MMP 1-O-methyltransferase
MLFKTIREMFSGPDPAASSEAREAALEARLEELAAGIEPIQGWLNREAGKFLYRMARFGAPVPNIVELGSWKGRSTAWFANGVRDRGAGRVYAVDTWKGTQNEQIHGEMLAGYAEDQLYREFAANLESRGLLQFVEPIRSDTLAAARNWDPAKKIGVLFIDADHSYQAARQDFEFWSPYVEVGGFVVFDDVPGWWGPTRLATELPKWYSMAGMSPNNFIFIKTGYEAAS